MFLEEVLDATRIRVKRSKEARPASLLRGMIAGRGPGVSLFRTISRKQGEAIRVIAEVKRMSPSRGPIRPDLVLEDLVKDYELGGASAVSVLTEPDFFGGSLEDMERSGKITGLPILRKDFIIDPYQLLESKAAGADAFLLIAAILERNELEALLREAGELGLEALVEVHNREELETVLESGASLIGINNRDLKTLQVDMETTLRLAPLVPDSKAVVGESGYSLRERVVEAMACGIDAVLVGEALVRDVEPGLALRILKGEANAPA